MPDLSDYLLATWTAGAGVITTAVRDVQLVQLETKE